MIVIVNPIVPINSLLDDIILNHFFLELLDKKEHLSTVLNYLMNTELGNLEWLLIVTDFEENDAFDCYFVRNSRNRMVVFLVWKWTWIYLHIYSTKSCGELKAPVTSVRDRPAGPRDGHGETQMYTACRGVTDTGDRVVHGVERRHLDKSCQLGHCPMPRHSICSLAPIAGRANMDLIRNQIDGVVPYRDIFLVQKDWFCWFF